MTRVSQILFFGAVLMMSSCDPVEIIDPPGIEIDVIADSVTFAVIGDFGRSGDNELHVSEMVKSWNPDFIITTGDNNYPSGAPETLKENITDYYGDYIYNFDAVPDDQCNGIAFQEKQNRFFPCPGNHDTYTLSDLKPYLNYFTLPGNELNYKFFWGSVAFYSINSTGKNLSEQYDWLKSEISRSDKPFTIVYFHHSPYSTGDHGDEPAMQWDFLSMGVNAVITGHDHLYSRIEKLDEPGLTYLVNGAGGKSLYSCGENPLDLSEFSVICQDKSFGAIRGRADNDRLILEFFTVDNQEVPFDSLQIMVN